MARGQTILLVDDDRDLVESMRAFLGARGYEVCVAYNGTEAREEMTRTRPDLIVLDVMMDTETEGFNLAHELHEDPRTVDIPIVLLSGFTEHLDTKTDVFEPLMYRDWPAARFFKKPVRLAELADAIADLLARRPATDEEA